MKENEREKLLNQKFKTLPERLRQALTDEGSDLIEAVSDDIPMKYHLSADAPLIIDEEIRNVLFGFTNPKDFIRKLSTVLNIDGQMATAIAKEVNEVIFQPVRDDLVLLNSGSAVAAVPPKPINEIKERLAREDAAARLNNQLKPLAAELEESVGLGRPREIVESIKTYPKDYERASHQTEKQSAVEKAPDTFNPRPTSIMPKWPVADRPAASPPPPPRFTETEFKPKTSPLPTPPKPPAYAPTRTPPPPAYQPPKNEPQIGVPRYGGPEDHEENSNEEQLNRDEILRAIENPSSIKTPPHPIQPTQPRPSQNPGNYGVDPYREPTE